MTPEQAIEFFIAKIQAQAQRDGIKLDDLEIDMLHYSSENEMLFTEINQRFEKKYSSDDYEKKMGKLLSEARKHDLQIAKKNGSKISEIKREYNRTRQVFRGRDFYMDVLLDEAGMGSVGWVDMKMSFRNRMYLILALVVVFCVVTRELLRIYSEPVYNWVTRYHLQWFLFILVFVIWVDLEIRERKG